MEQRPSKERGKAACRAKERRFSNCKKERGAHSATTEYPPCNAKQDGPETRGIVRETFSKTVQYGPVAVGVSTDRTQTWEHDRRNRRANHRRGRSTAHR